MKLPAIRIPIQGIDQFTATIGKAMAGMKKLGKSVSNVGTKMTLALTVPMLAFGVGSLKTAGNFERAMQRVANVSQANITQQKEMTGLARQLGATTLHSASAAAEGMVFLGQAGFKTREIMSSLPSVLDIATVAQVELGEAADLASNILTGYGKKASETGTLVDQLVKTTFNANTNFKQLAEAMSFVAPQAKAMKVPFQQAAAVVGMLSNAGIQGARAGTNFRAMLVSLAKPSREAIGVLNKLKIPQSQIKDSMGNITDFRKVIELFGKSGATNADLVTIFGTKMTSGFQAVLRQGLPIFDKLTQEINNSKGASREAARAFEEGLLGQTKALTSAFEELQLAMFVDTGLLKDITSIITSLTVHLRSFAKTNPLILKTLVIFGGIAAVLGPLVFIVGQLITAFSVVGGAIASAGGVIALITNPIGWIILAIGALLSILKMAGLRWEEIWRMMMWPFTPFVAAVEFIIENFSRLTPFFKLLFYGIVFLFKKFVGVIKPILQPFYHILNEIISFLKEIFDFGLGALEGFAAKLLPDDIKKKIGFVDPKEGSNAGSDFVNNLVNDVGRYSKQVVETSSQVLVKFQNPPAGTVIEKEKGPVDIESSRGGLLPALGGNL